MKKSQATLPLYVILFAMSCMGPVFAKTTLVATNSNVENIEKVITQVKEKIHFLKSFSDTELPADQVVAFPQQIPAGKTKLYASFSAWAKDIYSISIAATPDCDEVKTCTIGTLQIQYIQNPTIFYDRDNKQQTTQVSLDKGINGFFTHGFAMGDFWPANIQWRDREVLYILTWTTIDDKNTFVQMANSVIKQLHH